MERCTYLCSKGRSLQPCVEGELEMQAVFSGCLLCAVSHEAGAERALPGSNLGPGRPCPAPLPGPEAAGAACEGTGILA